jgi:hypothetical protein
VDEVYRLCKGGIFARMKLVEEFLMEIENCNALNLALNLALNPNVPSQAPSHLTWEMG